MDIKAIDGQARALRVETSRCSVWEHCGRGSRPSTAVTFATPPSPRSTQQSLTPRTETWMLTECQESHYLGLTAPNVLHPPRTSAHPAPHTPLLPRLPRATTAGRRLFPPAHFQLCVPGGSTSCDITSGRGSGAPPLESLLPSPGAIRAAHCAVIADGVRRGGGARCPWCGGRAMSLARWRGVWQQGLDSFKFGRPSVVN
ncbi:hypothetical protein B0H11DRAFT_2264305 [Mycena galericulata]|nr:hypothetical protein B0H11DRAFT_2264305 [Mycena galericulata]